MGKIENRSYADRREYLLAYEARRMLEDPEFRERRRRHKRESARRRAAREKAEALTSAPKSGKIPKSLKTKAPEMAVQAHEQVPG